MTKCRQCGITILDNTSVCPLCRCVVEQADESPAGHRTYGSNNDDAYPDVWLRERKLKHVCNISFFAVLAASAVLAICNFAFYDGSLWCLIPIAAMAYAYLVFRLVIISSKGYRAKVLIPLFAMVLLSLVIDVETGFYRWSLNYVFPSCILVMDLVIIILMLTNLKNWQSYIIMQIGISAVSLIPLLLWLMGFITSPLLSIIAAGASILMFLGAVIMGDRTARTELKRRFHIR